MLFDGLIHRILAEKCHTDTYEEDEKQARYLEICSSKAHMEIAPRVYAVSNRFITLKSKEAKRKVISQAFQIMVKNYTLSASERPKNDYNNLKGIDPDIENVKRIGLISSNPMMTSRALRALMCGGNVERLIGTDGRSFENVLVAHLELFFENIIQASSVEKHTLLEAWSPHRTPQKIGAEEDKSTQEEILNHLKERLGQNSDADLKGVCTKIINAVFKEESRGESESKSRPKYVMDEHASFALVTSQSSQQVQGPDVIVFHSYWITSSSTSTYKIKVDVYLYQAKNYKTSTFAVGDIASETNSKLVHSLGVSTSGSANSMRSAYYSKEGVASFLHLLETRMNTELSEMPKDGNRKFETQFVIKKKILVVSEVYRNQLDGIYKAFHDDHGITVWTRENLQPTISVLEEDEMSSTSQDEADEYTIYCKI
jgi:hypothetical protein